MTKTARTARRPAVLACFVLATLARSTPLMGQGDRDAILSTPITLGLSSSDRAVFDEPRLERLDSEFDRDLGGWSPHASLQPLGRWGRHGRRHAREAGAQLALRVESVDVRQTGRDTIRLPSGRSYRFRGGRVELQATLIDVGLEEAEAVLADWTIIVDRSEPSYFEPREYVAEVEVDTDELLDEALIDACERSLTRAVAQRLWERREGLEQLLPALSPDAQRAFTDRTLLVAASEHGGLPRHTLARALLLTWSGWADGTESSWNTQACEFCGSLQAGRCRCDGVVTLTELRDGLVGHLMLEPTGGTKVEQLLGGLAPHRPSASMERVREIAQALSEYWSHRRAHLIERSRTPASSADEGAVFLVMAEPPAFLAQLDPDLVDTAERVLQRVDPASLGRDGFDWRHKPPFVVLQSNRSGEPQVIETLSGRQLDRQALEELLIRAVSVSDGGVKE